METVTFKPGLIMQQRVIEDTGNQLLEEEPVAQPNPAPARFL